MATTSNHSDRRQLDPAHQREFAAAGAQYFGAAVRAGATLGEMCDALRDVWGEYVETPVI